MSGLAASITSGVHNIAKLRDQKVQTFRGIAGDYVTDDDLFNQKYIEYEIAQIKTYLEDPLVRWLYIVAGLIGSTLNAMAQPGANMLRLEGSILQDVRQFAPDAVRDLELSQMHTTNKRLKTLIGEAVPGPAAPPVTVPAPATSESVALRTAILGIAPVGELNFSTTNEITTALREIVTVILQDVGSVFDVTGKQITTGDNEIDAMRRISNLYAVETRSIRKNEKQAFSPVSGKYHAVWESIIKRNLFPSIPQRDVFVSMYGGPVLDAVKELSESASKQVPNPVLSVPANVPPARAAQLGLGEPMNKLTYADALRWLIENKSSPTETDMAIIRQLYAPKPANHPDWQLMPHHSKHIVLAPNVSAAIQSCEESVREKSAIKTLSSDTLIKNDTLRMPFATLVAAFIQWKQVGTSSFTSIHNSQIMFNAYHEALDKFARLHMSGTSYEFALPAPPPESRAMRMMRMYGGIA